MQGFTIYGATPEGDTKLNTMAPEENGGKRQTTNGWEVVPVEEEKCPLREPRVAIADPEEGGNGDRKCRPFWQKWCHNGCPFWCRKYFWEGTCLSHKYCVTKCRSPILTGSYAY